MFYENSIKQKINISRVDKTQNEDIGKIDLQIDAQGDFVNLLSYLDALEHGDYLIAISEINLNRDTSYLINMTLKAEVYVQN